MMQNQHVAVVLFQLGGPDSLDAVEPFLYNLFCDEDIINFPGAFIARRLLAKLISSRRSKPIARHYEEIGGSSPINRSTESQARALEISLRGKGLPATVFTAMRYWHPMTNAAAQSIRDGAFSQVVLLPLYPQFSRATTYSSLNEWNRQSKAFGISSLDTRLICCYPNHPLLIEAFVERISATLRRFEGVDPKEIILIFSAHGVPISFIRRGDPYKLHVEETVRQVMEQGGWSSPHTLCYQSKVGPQKWLSPSLVDTIREYAHAGRKNVVVIPIAFVTDHIETLHEINIEVREEAEHLGIDRFELMPALNDHPSFIRCLTELVLSTVQSGERQVSKCRQLRAKSPADPPPTLCPWYRQTKR